MSTTINEASTIELATSEPITENNLPSEHLNVANYSPNLTVFDAYHISEIQQNDTIIATAKWIIWAGFGVICLGIFFALLGKVDVSLITTSSGIITEIISAVVFAFVTQSNKSKLQYFTQLSLSDERDKYIQIISSLDKEAKERLLEQLISNYCKLRKPQD